MGLEDGLAVLDGTFEIDSRIGGDRHQRLPTGTCREQLHRAYFIIAADPDGHGLVGMSDRVTAIGGPVRIESPAGGGTPVAALLPL